MGIKQVQRVSMWDKDSIVPLFTGLRIAEGTAEHEDVGSQTIDHTDEHCAIGLPVFRPSVPTSGGELRCSHCRATFTSRQDQVEHYRLDWHRFNLGRSMMNKPPLTQEQFLNDLSDISSISGSDEEDEEEEDEGEEEENENSDVEEQGGTVLRRQARMFFSNVDGNVISLYRTLLLDKKGEVSGEREWVQRVLAAPRRPHVAVIMLAGGHFAAAVFKGSDVVIHKTFHNYTVRAKQGGSQGAKDGQSGTSHPKSAGASLRRYNEQSQLQHIQELMESWKSHLDRCDLIFVRAKKHNRRTLFGGKRPVLRAKDDRVRSIPFTTTRPKFSEVKRAHAELFEVIVHGTEEEFKDMIKESAVGEVKTSVKKKENSPTKASKPPKSERANPSKNLQQYSDSEGEEISPRRGRKGKGSRRVNSILDVVQSSSEDEDGEFLIEDPMVSFSTRDIGGGPDCSFSPQALRALEAMERTNKKREKTSPKKDAAKYKERVWNELYTGCKTGNLIRVQVALKLTQPTSQDGQTKALLTALEHTNIPSDLAFITFGKNNRTMLHVAAESNHKELVWWLLEQGCDPSVTDDKGLPPYGLARDKPTKNAFRRFWAEHPRKFDYSQAKIPSPLTKEEEEQEIAKEAEKKKAQKKAKQLKQKEKKQRELEIQKAKEERERQIKLDKEEKERFLKLSDREKRALAAERRLLASAPEAAVVSRQRCFMCGQDLTAVTPFEYNDYKFCTTKCVRDHRSKN